MNSFVLLTLVMQVGIFLGCERQKSNFIWSEIGCFFAQVSRLRDGTSGSQGVQTNRGNGVVLTVIFTRVPAILTLD